MKSLIVVAHPDDEVLWFSSILLRDKCDVICVTCGRDKYDREIRRNAFEKSMNILGIDSYDMLFYPDKKQRLDTKKLIKYFENLPKDEYSKVYTHGPYGETYENPHHQDVCYSVHTQFNNPFSISWNLYPDIINELDQEEYRIKKYLLGTVYSREYKLLKDAYEISNVEKFVRLSKESIEIYYFGISNFGDNHEFLGRKYPDFWGFKNSPYELERHQMIFDLTKSVPHNNIIEFGSCEGVLTERLNQIGNIFCVEKAPIYKERLKNKGFKLIDNPKTEQYDISIISAFLEYLPNPGKFLKSIKSNYLLVDVILNSGLDNKLKNILNEYLIIDEKIIRPRWENIFYGDKKDKLEVYRMGSHGYLFKRQ